MSKTYVELPSGAVLETDSPEVWPEATRLSAAKGKAILKAEAIAYLRKLLRPGATVYAVLRHVSASGMNRSISLYIVKRGAILGISHSAARAMERKLGHAEGIAIGGCGTDMGFVLVYELGRTLYPKGFKLRKGNHGRNGDTSGRDSDGGYAFNCQWI